MIENAIEKLVIIRNSGTPYYMKPEGETNTNWHRDILYIYFLTVQSFKKPIALLYLMTAL